MVRGPILWQYDSLMSRMLTQNNFCHGQILVIVAPFNFRTVTEKNGRIKVKVTRMYGCVLHSHLRENVIRKEGPRNGWEPFGKW